MAEGLFGLDAEIAGKLLAKRDLEWEQEVMRWVEGVLGTPLVTTDVQACLQNGVVLCRLMNKLVPGTITSYNEEAKLKSPLQEVENVQVYLRGCWKIGVEDAFTVSDLRKKTGVGLVVNNIASLCRTAVSLGTWKGTALGPIQTKENTTRKWAPVDTVPNYRHTDDVGDSEFDRALTRMNLELVEATQECSRLTAVRLNLLEERRGVKESQEAERSKLKSKIAEVEAAIAVKSGNVGKAAAAPTAIVSDASWQDAAAAVAALSKQLDAAREAREAAEERANKVATRVASLAAQRAELEELLQREPVSVTVATPPPPEDNKVIVRAVQNASGFYYTASKGTDTEKLESLQDKIRDLMLSRPVDFGVVAMLAAEFRVEAGRRVFGVCLKIMLKQRKRVELKNDSFELLLYLLNTSLVSMDLAKASDFITGRVILSASHKIYRRSDAGGEDYVFNYIRDHPLWQSLDFWEENFWTVEVRRVRKTGANVGFVQAAVSMVYNAYTWNLKHPTETRALLHRILQKESEQTLDEAWAQLQQLMPPPPPRPASPRSLSPRMPNRPAPAVGLKKEIRERASGAGATPLPGSSERDKMISEL